MVTCCAPDRWPGQRTEPLCELEKNPSSLADKYGVWGLESDLVFNPYLPPWLDILVQCANCTCILLSVLDRCEPHSTGGRCGY